MINDKKLYVARVIYVENNELDECIKLIYMEEDYIQKFDKETNKFHKIHMTKFYDFKRGVLLNVKRNGVNIYLKCDGKVDVLQVVPIKSINDILTEMESNLFQRKLLLNK